MLLKDRTKTLVVLSAMAALSTVFTVLGTVIVVNTLFFTAAAAFFVGIVVCRYGMKYGILYFFVCSALDFILNPNKLNVLLYMALAGYLLLSEGIWRAMLKRGSSEKTRMRCHRGIRLLIFEAIYLPFLFWAPQLLVSPKVLQFSWYVYVMIPAGIVAWVIYDLAYFSAKNFIQTRLQIK